MENVKKYNEFINEELNPETYDNIISAASERGDLRGKRLSNMARDLKSKNSPTSIVKLYSSDGPEMGQYTINLNDVLTDKGVIWLGGDFRNTNRYKLGIDTKYKIYNAFLLDSMGGGTGPVYFDRGSIKKLLDIFNKKGWENWTDPSKYPSI